MKISYPIRDKEGKEFRSLDEIMRLIDAEAHGTWLLGGNGLWHGGIHISDVSNPLSALKPDTAATGEPVPLQFMADGTIAAYRINNDYLKGTYKGQQLRYSSTFVLVKSQCQPDPQKKESWLEFYCLYMHLAPVNDYPGSPCYKVKTGHGGILLHRYIPGKNGLPEGQESGDHATYWIPPKISGNRTLNAGDRFVSSRTGRFYVTNNGQPVLTTFGLVRLLEGNKPGNEQYWVTLDPDLMESDGEIQMLMPEWMQKAKAKGIFDSVQTVDETEEWKVSAGTPVGFMGCEDYPGEGSGEIEREWFVHLEVLSTDPNMPKFLSNPAGVKGEKRTILAPKGIILYTRQAVPGQEVFTATAATLGAQRVLPREATTPVTDESQQWWFNITGTGWLPQKDVEEAGQYDLLKLGFQPLEENSSGDMTYSPYEGWVPEAFDSISRAAEQGDEWLYEQVPPFYRELMAGMDQDGDGKVTEEEIRQALIVREPLVRNVVNHLIVKHHSEWYGGRSTGRWEGFYKDLDTEEVAYCEKWQLDLEWMSGVSPFNSDDAVWHFHPVVFLDAINSKSVCACNRDITLDELKKVAPAVSEGLLKRYLYDINAGFIRFGMTTCREKAHFLAQIIHESGYFRYTKEINGESASYSPWYGRGLIQVTGESNYTAYGEYINEDVTSSDSARDKLISSPHCVLSAFWYFNIFKRINEDAKSDDFNKITAVINGGYNHYDERLSIFNKLVTSLAAEHLNQKEMNDDFLFDDSDVYDNKVYALGWGIWHDPDSSRRGTIKSNEEALKGYRRAKELIDLHPFPQEGREGDRKVYGIEKRNISTFVERRITELE
ncbi:chitinase [Escherichia coli]|uniref:glycoside hydrolase family 19 protein n=3 Tax=Escherichia coli TaxID=562 RepID=UPI000BB615A5|nr:chitinase [Escherichia coli]EHT8281019.1 chitinase [Escherichia coli]PBR54472.1 chitinase [Escherichia coli]HAG5916121.1 chitinase [Escherichia coli]HBP9484256.1 chitinase [Escherichia coli]